MFFSPSALLLRRYDREDSNPEAKSKRKDGARSDMEFVRVGPMGNVI